MARSRTCPPLAGLLAALAGALTPAAAQTTLETGLSAERLRLALDAEGIIDVEWARATAHTRVDLGLWLHFAKNPVILYQQASRARLGAWVENRLGGGLVASVGLFERLQLGVELPFIVAQSGPRQIDGVTAGGSLPELASAGLGDLALVPKLGLLRSEHAGIDLALLAWVTLPTGGGDDFLGERAVTVSPELLASRAFGGWRLATNAGVTLRGRRAVLDQRLDHELRLRLGVGYRFGEGGGPPLELGVSGDVATALERPFSRYNETSAELKGQASYTFGGVVSAFVGAGAGLAHGFGTPDWRVFAGARGRLEPPPPPPPDQDGDGVADAVDRCAGEPETVNAYQDDDGCPDDPDPDHDGVRAEADRCPREAETVNGFQDEDGCPDLAPDTDGDTTPDDADACPTEPEDRDGFEDVDGCPDPDNDQDGVLDSLDGCPSASGPATNRGCPDPDRDADGVVDRLDNCPTVPGPARFQGCTTKQLAVIRADAIEIADVVYFDTGKDVIQRRSFALLDQVAAIVLAHPELERLRVEGHTDDQGNAAKNRDLSARRAAAVVRYFQGRGIAAERLESAGYGPARPIASNRTAEGRARNRRVQFTIVPTGKKEN